MRTATTILTIPALIGSVSLAAGCGGGSDEGAGKSSGTKTEQQQSSRTTAKPEEPVDVEELEKRLETVLTRQPQPAIEVPGQATPARPAIAGFRVRSVACPDDVERRKGERFKCRVDAGKSGDGTVGLTQVDERGRVFRFRSKQRQSGVTTTIRGTLRLDRARAEPGPTATVPDPTGAGPDPPTSGRGGGTQTYDLRDPEDVEEACKRLPDSCKFYPR